MESLQLLSIKSLLDNYNWNDTELTSIKNKIDDIIYERKVDKLKGFFELSDIDKRFTEQLHSSIIQIKVSADNSITVEYEGIIYYIKTKYYGNQLFHKLNIERPHEFTRHLSFTHWKDIIYPYSNIFFNDDRIPEQIRLYGLFLWQNYNKYYNSQYFCEEKNEYLIPNIKLFKDFI